VFDPVFIDKLAEALTPRLAALLSDRLKPAPVVASEWLTREQAAQYVGATKEALRGMLRAGLFPVYRAKGRERIRKEDIDQAFLENKTYLQ
jgi:excisionase family DNA binding protein